MSFIDRPAYQIEIGSPLWFEEVVDFLSNDEDILLIDPRTRRQARVRAASQRPNRPIWGQTRAILRKSGIAAPRARWQR